MTTQEINEVLHALNEHYNMLEESFVENGGEVTEETTSLEDSIADIQELLLGDGVDSLGRWLKSKEDQKAALKAEKARIESMIKATDRTIDYIKNLIDTILFACGKDQVKGMLYSFKRTVSTTHTPNTGLIDERYADKVNEIAEEAGLPVWLKVKVSPSWSLVPSGVETDEFITTSTPTVTFRKPAKSKEQ